MGVSLFGNETLQPEVVMEIASLNLYMQMYYTIYVLTFAYLFKLLIQNGLPSLMVDNITTSDTNLPNFYLGTRELGMGLFYYINVAERQFKLKFIVQKTEGKMILMALCFPFSLFMTIIAGLIIDCGKITWEMECNDAIDVLTTVLQRFNMR